MLNIFLYAVGWLLYVAAQAQNSIASTSNGLAGAAGLKFWLRKQTVNLLTRAFFSSLAYGFIVHTMTAKIQAVGFPIESAAIAGVAGYSANALLYQFLGLFPGLRVEMSTLAPPDMPAAAEKVP
jgi:hypothetical protein